MSLAPYVQIIARGKGRARPMTLPEAQSAMTLMLSDEAEPEATGAILMVLRLRGEVADEIAGFTAALRSQAKGTLPSADLDWPVYAAGRTRGVPFYLLAARLVAQAGYTISMHGWNAPEALRDHLHLAGDGVHYSPLEDIAPAAFRLLQLRATFGLRSCINTVLRMWNPSHAPATVQGVFHPSYRSLQAQAAEMLGQRDLTIIKGGGGEFERNPAKDITLFGLRDGLHIQQPASAMMRVTRKLHEADSAIDLDALWHGGITDPFAISTITGTAALALWTLKAASTLSEAETMAADLWNAR